jgi:hypothetical protein
MHLVKLVINLTLIFSIFTAHAEETYVQINRVSFHSKPVTLYSFL